MQQSRGLSAEANLDCTRQFCRRNALQRGLVERWWLNGRVLRRRHFSLLQVKLLDALVPLLRRIDRYTPLPALTLIAVLERVEETPAAAPVAQGQAVSSKPVG